MPCGMITCPSNRYVWNESTFRTLLGGSPGDRTANWFKTMLRQGFVLIFDINPGQTALHRLPVRPPHNGSDMRLHAYLKGNLVPERAEAQGMTVAKDSNPQDLVLSSLELDRVAF